MKCIERESINTKLQWNCGRGNMQFSLVMVSPGGGGVLWIQVMGMIEWGEKSKPSKTPQGFQQNAKTSLDQKLTPKKFILPFSTQIFRLFWISKKYPYLNQTTQKNISEIFLPKKISGIKNFKHPKNPSISSATWNPEYPPFGMVCKGMLGYIHLWVDTAW